ncbi:hypothetical protein BP5796_06917 [Coleophoma crateriformis]|uniref:Rhodopsin domain-containing protein n=1 Tax=Coleophoma crateriformis TaxID=565419 RepID=A0A3D8RQ75_9HELO|nr:hypothetical protein BP5796_06917 [Coleophoma crateriformis]
MVSGPAISVLATSIAFTTGAAFIVICRLFTRVVILKNSGADDWLMLAAIACSFAFMTVILFQIKYGLGTPISTFTEAQGVKFLQCLWATIPIYNLSLLFSKLSIICQYMRIFTTPNVLKLCRVMIGVLILYGCWTVFGSAFMCIPVNFFWDSSIKGSCMNKLAFWFSNAALNITTDLMIFAIPIPLVRQLQLPKKQKIALMFVFAFGAFVCVTSVIRLKALYQISVSIDTSLDGVSTAIWSGIEINVAIGCASLPALKPLLGRIFPGLLSSNGSRNKSNMYPLSGVGGSNHMDTLRSRSKAEDKDAFNVTVQRDIYQQSEDVERRSREGSERSLVNWKTNIYSEDQRVKETHIPM